MKKSLSRNAIIEEANSITVNFMEAFEIIRLNVFRNIEQLGIVDVVLAIRKCKGKIVTSGMGKAGYAMQKFSSILCSFGIPSCYLHPGTASHGDLGVLSKNDMLFVASTSGKTREVLETIDLARELGVKQIVGITSHPDSPIRKKADIIMDMGIIEEAGHLGLAPTTSILIMLALTDCVALIAAKDKNLTKQQYGKYHHSGYLGSQARSDNKIY
jgi:arabinose-5-phosphate isomerase